MIIEPLSHKIRKPQLNPEAPTGTDISMLQNRGRQLILELDRQHSLLIQFAREGLKPDVAAWRGVKRTMAKYAEGYSELIGIAKVLNRETQIKKENDINDE